jgi:hypothetical protein
MLMACILALSLTAALGSAPAQALSPPDVFLQELDASDQPTGGWVALQGAQMHSVNGLRDRRSASEHRAAGQSPALPSGRLDLSFPAPCKPFRC